MVNELFIAASGQKFPTGYYDQSRRELFVKECLTSYSATSESVAVSDARIAKSVAVLMLRKPEGVLFTYVQSIKTVNQIMKELNMT